LNELQFWDYIGFGKVITMDIKSGIKPLQSNKKQEKLVSFAETKV